MILSLLLLASQPLDQADRLNAALTNCLFAVAREAHAHSIPAAQFSARVDQSCRAEEAAARTALISVLLARGMTRAEAIESTNSTRRCGRIALVRAYSASDVSPR